MEYLDREGGKYLATKLKSYVDNKVTDLPSGGTVDLTNYYTKEETDQLLANLPSGGTGTKGDKGDTGVGVSSIKLVNYELIITLTDGTVHNLGNVRGEKGKDGTKGTDGVSPTVSVTETTNGHTVAITDANGTQSFDVLNGKDGNGGGSSGGASVVYSTDETAIGTWIDGKTIYRKVYQIPKLDSVDGDFDRTDVNLNLQIDSIINIHPIWKYGNNSGTVIVGNYCTLGVFNDYNTSSMASTLNEQKKSEMNVTYDFGANSKKIKIWRGSSAMGYACTLIVEYTKL